MDERNPILIKENIRLHCTPVSKHEAIDAVGTLLLKTGYVTEKYIEGMHNREEKLTVYIGNMLAIPHGEYEVKDEIIRSGIAVMIYPQGISWNDEVVKVVMGIAGVGDAHMKILANTAMLFSDLKMVEEIVNMNDIDEVFELLTKEYEE